MTYSVSHRTILFICILFISKSCSGVTTGGKLTTIPTSDWRAAARKKLDTIEQELHENEKECLYLMKTVEAIRTAELQGVRSMVRRAAFDIGSGATKVEVADVKLHVGILPRPQKAVYSEKINILLSEDLEQSTDGSFSLSALNELDKFLKAFKVKATEAGAEQFAGVATAAFRKAENGPEFLRKMETELGIRLRIITQARFCDANTTRETSKWLTKHYAGPRVNAGVEDGAVCFSRADALRANCLGLWRRLFPGLLSS